MKMFLYCHCGYLTNQEILAFFMKLESKLLSVSLMESIVLGTTLKSVIASMISLLMLVKTLEELWCFQKMMI